VTITVVFITIVIMTLATITVVFISPTVKTAMVEVAIMLSFKERAIVCIVVMIAIVPVPGGIVIINIPGEFIFIYDGITTFLVCRGGRITVVVDRRGLIGRSRLINYRSRGDIGGSGRNINPRAGDTEANVRIDINLGITLGSDETGSYYDGEDQ
jgi:hypothetical protein